MKKTEAVIYAATQRLRPILMTSLAMSLGALPLALSLGASATSRIPLGVVIVGGIHVLPGAHFICYPCDVFFPLQQKEEKRNR